MFTMHTPPAPPVPVWFPLKGSILSPEWTHAITTIMGHPLSSESGKSIQKWILYHAIQDPIEFWLYWDPTDPYDIKLLQEYVGSNGSVVYLPSSTIKSLISLWNYMNLLIKKGKSVDEKCNAQYFFQDDQWFNLTAHDMRRTLVNAGMKYHRPQIIPGTPLSNSTSPPSPAPMKSLIHLELTPCDSISTATPVKKPCPVNTSCDHIPHLDHPSTSLEPQDHSIVGSAEPESILESEDILQLDSISVSPQATCNFETESLPEFKGQLDDINLDPTDTPSTIPTAFQAPRDDTYNPECTHNPMAIQCNNTLTLVTTQHYHNFWHTTIVRTWIPLTLQVQYQPLSKLPNIVPITLLQARLRKAIIPTLWLSHTHQILGSMLWKGLLHQQLL